MLASAAKVREAPAPGGLAFTIGSPSGARSLPVHGAPQVLQALHAAPQSAGPRRSGISSSEQGHAGSLLATAFAAIAATVTSASCRQAPYARRARPVRRAGNDFATQLRNRLGQKRVVLEEELLEAKRQAAAAEQKALELQKGFEAELKEEKAVFDCLREELLKVKQTYDILNDELEMVQVEGSMKLKATDAALKKASEDLQQSKKNEVALLGRLAVAEELAHKLSEERKVLVQQINEATAKERSLEAQLSSKELAAQQIAEELVRETANNEQLKADLDRQNMRETEYKRWIGKVEDENRKLREKLDSVQDLELSEKELLSELELAHQSNNQLNDDLAKAEAKLTALMSRQFSAPAAAAAKQAPGAAPQAAVQPAATAVSVGSKVPSREEVAKLKEEADLAVWAAKSLADKGSAQAAEMQAKAQDKVKTYESLKALVP